MERKRNTGRIVLIAVLAVSLLGNALTLGAALRLRALRADLLGPEAAQALYPREMRSVLRDALTSHADQLRPELHDLVAARAAVVAAGTARPFERAALDAAMADLRARFDTTLADVQKVLADALEAEAAK